MSINKLETFDGDVELPLFALIILVKFLQGSAFLFPGGGVHTHHSNQLVTGHLKVTDTEGEQYKRYHKALHAMYFIHINFNIASI